MLRPIQHAMATGLLVAGLFGGCESPETKPADVPVGASASVPETLPEVAKDSDADRRDQIATMYAGYRARDLADVPEIEVGELAHADSRASTLLVDCREDDERAVSIISGAITKDEFERDAERYRDHRIVAYCTIGYRSGLYTLQLAERGFDSLNLVGGVLAWAHDGGSFVDPRGEETNRVHVYGATWDLLPEGYESVLDD